MPFNLLICFALSFDSNEYQMRRKNSGSSYMSLQRVVSIKHPEVNNGFNIDFLYCDL